MPKRLSQDLDKFRKVIAQAIEINGFVGYWQARGYVEGIEVLLPSFEELIKAGKSADAITLIEHTMRLMEKNWSNVDDSDGGMSDVFKELQHLHLKACRSAKPDSAKLAKHLFEWAMETDYDAFHDVPRDYAEVLGTEGMAEMGRLINEGFAEVEPAYPGASFMETTG